MITKIFNKVALGVISFLFPLSSFLLTSCYNADKEFPDYEGGTTAYFAYQNPVRTLILGNDIYDNTLDNEHKCRIWATMGGAYHGRDAVATIVVEESLCNNLYFTDEGGNPDEPVRPMPTSHYRLLSNTIPYNGDSSVKDYYVIPIRMMEVTGIDHILSGTPREGLDPSRTNTEDWEVLAKDYVLYCVKYMNPWQGKYIRRGIDQVTEKGVLSTVVRRDVSLVNSDLEHYKENPVNQNDEICEIKTKNMSQAIFPVQFKTSGASIQCNLILTFNGDQCTISTDDKDVTATGSGEFIAKGTERSEYKDFQWGSNNGQPVQRDILRLAYDVKFASSDIQVSTTDTLVVQTRESNKREFFSSKYVK